MAKRGGPHPRAHGASGSPGGPPPAIPDKLYFRIGEVARLCRVPTYVLRFWQTEFPQLRPGKSGTGQRLYRRRDVEMALRIQHLLHQEGYTIAGAKGVLAAEAAIPAPLRPPPEPPPTPPGQSELPLPIRQEPDDALVKLRMVRGELRELLALLQRKPAARPAEFSTPRLFLQRDSKPPSE